MKDIVAHLTFAMVDNICNKLFLNELLDTNVTHANLQLIFEDLGKLSCQLIQEWNSHVFVTNVTPDYFLILLFRSVGNVIEVLRRHFSARGLPSFSSI